MLFAGKRSQHCGWHVSILPVSPLLVVMVVVLPLLLVKIEVGTVRLHQAAVEGDGLEKRPDVRLLGDLRRESAQCGQITVSKVHATPLTRRATPLADNARRIFASKPAEENVPLRGDGKRSTKGSFLG